MDSRKQIQTIRVTLLVVMIVLGLADISSAQDLESQLKGSSAQDLESQLRSSSAQDVHLTVKNRVTVSDNINRSAVGSEREGFLLATEGDFTFTGMVGSGTAEMGIGGGWETLDDGQQVSDDDNFRFGLKLTLPWSRTGHVLGSVTSSDGTTEPDITDINQERVRTKTIEKRLEVGNQAAVNASWQLALTNYTEERYDRDQEENEIVLICELGLDRINSLIASVGFLDGEEKMQGDTWTRSSVVFDIQRNQSPVTSKGYRIRWESQKTVRPAGSDFRTNKLGLLAYYMTTMQSGLSFSGDVGIDVIHPRSDDRRWEPYTRVILLGTQERTFQPKGLLFSAATLPDPLDDRVGWERETQIQGGGAWRVTRRYTVEPIIRYRLAELHGNESASRTDETLILRLETRLNLTQEWMIELNAQNEEVSSSQAVYDLKENRIELSVTGALF